MTTPFYPEGGVYYKKIEHNVDRYSRTTVAGLVVLGSTGEAVMLSDDERREVLRETPPMTAAKLELIDDGATGLVGAMQLALSGRHDVHWPDLMQLADIKERLEFQDKDLLSESVRKNMNLAQILSALHTVGARRLFDGTPIRGCGRQIRLWCMRERAAHKYERMGQTELTMRESFLRMEFRLAQLAEELHKNRE